jgi:Protein of unknown function (DUF4058)
MRRLLAPRVAPNYIVQFEDVENVRFLEVRNSHGRDLVTVIELLSPSNKRAGDDREQYLAKRRELLRSPAHLVEIDLLRGWTPMPREGRPECDYSVMVSRAEKRRAADLWPIRLRDRMPMIPIPLTKEPRQVHQETASAERRWSEIVRNRARSRRRDEGSRVA